MYALLYIHKSSLIDTQHRLMHAAGGAVMSMVYIALFHSMGYFTNTMQNMLGVIWMTSLVATAVEALPIYGWLDDNLTVPATAAILGQILQSTLT